MRWYIWTRSRNKDYRFIGSAPERWWAGFTSDTSFERPTLLLESARDGAWRLLASGIPSTRKDRHKTLIRYTIVGEGPVGEDVEKVHRLVSAWLDEAAAIFDDTGAEPLSSILNKHFSEEVLEEWFAADRAEEELSAEAQERLLRSIDELEPPPSDSGDEPAGGWYGSLHAAECRNAFLAQSFALLDGRGAGAAYLLNLAGDPSQLSVDFDRRASILLFDVPPDKAPKPTPLHQRPKDAAKKKDAPRRETDAPQPATSSSAGSTADDVDASDPHRDGAGRGDVAPDAVGDSSPNDRSDTPPESPIPASRDTSQRDEGAVESDGGDPYSPGALLRAFSGSDVVKRVRDASRGLEDVLGVSREVLEERLGIKKGTLDEVLGGGKEALEDVLGVSREVLEERLGIKKGTLDEVFEEKLGARRGNPIEEAITGIEDKLGIKRENLEEVLGLSVEALEERLGAGIQTAGRHTLDILKVLAAAAKEGAFAARGGASHSARELLVILKALSARADGEPQGRSHKREAQADDDEAAAGTEEPPEKPEPRDEGEEGPPERETT